MLSILVVAALSGMWDDETFLGKGPTVGAGVGVAISRHLSAEGEFDWGTHHRDSGALKVDGNAITAAGRLSFGFRDRDAAVRPFVSAGVAWIRSTDLFTWNTRQNYTTSTVSWEAGAGVEVKALDHWTIRPEARWTFAASDPGFKPGSLEPPLFGIRGGVTLAWIPRK